MPSSWWKKVALRALANVWERKNAPSRRRSANRARRFESLERRDLLTAVTLNFQNGLNGYAGTVDTWVEAAAPTTEHSTHYDIWIDKSSSAPTEQALLRFDNLFGSAQSQLRSDDVITSASLVLNANNAGGGMTLHRMLQSWIPTATWNSLGGGVQTDGSEAAATAEATVGAFGLTSISLNVTASLQAWQANPANNFGWLLQSTSTDGAEFDSAEGSITPKLVVNIDRPVVGTTVSVIAADSFVSEGTGVGLFVFTRAGDTTNSLTVNYTVGGTATSGSDYAALDGTVTFAPGISSKSVVVAAPNDGIAEANETVTVTITGSATIEADLASATVTIRDSSPTTSVIVPLSETFLLHSLPGARHTIYLDFDGETVVDPSWNDGNPIYAPAYDTDGDSSHFTDEELREIQRMWARVAEDFRPFQIDVTTELPNIERLRKVGAGDMEWGVRCIFSDPTNWSIPGGGVAQLDSFDSERDLPVWVDQADVGGENNLAGNASHEIGHSLGLDHDGSSTAGYYSGHGSGETEWAPIMGAPFSAVSTWSRGEYPGADNTEDDLALITSGYGFDYRPDDHGGAAASATPLVSLDGFGRFFGQGVIERNTDLDWFSFNVTAGSYDIAVDPAIVGANLDVRVDLFDANQTLLATSNPTNELSGNLTRTLTAGTYYLRIDGVGNPDPNSPGYSDYASLGEYSVIVSKSATQVTFQQGIGGYAGTDDTMVSQYFATTNQGANATLYVDGDTGGGYPAQSLLRFNAIIGNAVGQVPVGSLITSATLELNLTDEGGAFTMHSLLRNWSESDTWTTLGAGIATDGSEASTLPVTTADDYVTGWQTYDVTAAVAAWAANPAANFGLLLQPGTSWNGVDVASSESTTPPKLRIAYLPAIGSPQNTAPVANADSASVNEDSSTSIAVLANDADADGDALSVTGASAGAKGTTVVNANGTVTYTPNANANGSDSFTYVVSDGRGGTATGTVQVTINPVNDAPVAVGDSYSLTAGTTLTVAAPGVLGNDSDVDGPSLVAQLVSGPAHGTLTFNANGSFVYTPASGYVGADSFVYQASDGTAAAQATVTLTIQAGDDHGNSTGTATVMPFVANGTSTASGVLEQLGDLDFFRIDVTQNGKMTFTLTGAAGLDTYLRLYDATGTQIAFNDDYGGTYNSQVVKWLAAGTYYASAGAYNDASIGSYTFTAAHVPDDHNNAFDSTATALSLNAAGGTSATGTLEANGDADFFRLTLSSSRTLQFDLVGLTLSDPYLRLYNSSGSLIASNDDYGGTYNSRVTMTLSAGTYYISARAYGDNKTGTYRLDVATV